MDIENIGSYSKSLLTNVPVDQNHAIYKHYNATLPSFPNQAVYIYSFKENRMVYAEGWEEILGYRDDEITMLTIVTITTPKFLRFSAELNDKAMMFLKSITEDLEEYSFTLELEKIHKDGTIVPLFSRVGIHKAKDGQIEEIIGYSELIKTLRLGNVMQYAAYGPKVNEFEEALNKELFQHYAISRKEREALVLAAKGFAFKEIAEELGVSQSAIEKRIIPLYKRFNVKSLPHLIGFAYQNNIL
ncbi:LuxR C-terminal-related transcriptional regulator [Wenyingzhuangia sp. 2_MG-2023]|uniref:LuxR C-terminal-related transcriptional regulator n=1 Tax=Wenyingzhuangia sp. 2_MG-2023 TaxID=3062639 RepID=UPI0026E2EDA6|nr:LuxR C-terminal-related transcriptional regulator [Wenyingzhuangia sp. 2_MG-2023]MDO6739207.1 LuxR C-terminal-related transcriptional regulator [Wenyingzhuangia sp. 2_MG-2023]MDO6803792.1 LuxR C-terminal-related transcriptional regulator [Wenyingzhuangia sp. 1_MG-2023]